MPVDHYENFPVASLLLPAHLRAPIETLYHFARSADDIADEGDAPPEIRLADLDAYQKQLDLIEAGQVLETPLFVQLAKIIRTYQLPIQLFKDLVDAFSQDVEKKRYADYTELLDYARRSANPVGRLVLHIAGYATPNNLSDSDDICSALQLINFWQDILIDWEKERIYIPQSDLDYFGMSESDIASGQCSAQWVQLLDFQIERSRKLILRGAPLAKRLPGRLGFEIRLTIQGGLRILEKIQKITHSKAFYSRTTLNWMDWPILLVRSLFM